jgi:hypothetical protein
MHGTGTRAAVVLSIVAGALAVLLVTGGVRDRADQRVTAGVLTLGCTYGGPMAAHRAGPVSAALFGLVLLAIAQIAHREVLHVRRLPSETLGWTARTVVAVTVTSLVVDLVVALVSGGGRPRPDRPSALAVAIGCAVVAGAVAWLVALAEGRPSAGGAGAFTDDAASSPAARPSGDSG